MAGRRTEENNGEEKRVARRAIPPRPPSYHPLRHTHAHAYRSRPPFFYPLPSFSAPVPRSVPSPRPLHIPSSTSIYAPRMGSSVLCPMHLLSSFFCATGDAYSHAPPTAFPCRACHTSSPNSCHTVSLTAARVGALKVAEHGLATTKRSQPRSCTETTAINSRTSRSHEHTDTHPLSASLGEPHKRGSSLQSVNRSRLPCMRSCASASPS